MSLLSERVTSHLQQIVGQRLIEANLFCFDYEIDSSALENLPFYFGGELCLNFENDVAIITWDLKAGWQDCFSLYLGRERLNLPTSSLVKWNISKFQPWINCINKKLTFAQVYKDRIYNDTPHVVELNFDNTVIFVGDSSEMMLGDGDDVLITIELPDDNWEVIWKSSIL